MHELPALSAPQRELVSSVLPGARLVMNHSWGLVETTVLEVLSPRGRFIIKAGGATDHHISREIDAHERWLAPWTVGGRAAVLLRADRDAKVIITHHLPGNLVEGDISQHAPETFRQAGELLAAFHQQYSEQVSDWAGRAVHTALRWLDGPHRIDPDTEDRLRADIATWPTSSVTTLVPTHGDWQPRNWLIDDGTVRVIDFGRTALRPGITDIARLARQDFLRDAELEEAFLDGYGSDPREPQLWRRTLLSEAIGTAAWAFGVGAQDFEQVGHRQIAQLLGD